MKCEILVGVIASGKSTYARKRALQGAIIICDDDIVKMVHGGIYKGYDKSLKPLYKTIENNIMTTAIALGKDVVVDRGVNIRRTSRARFIGIAHSLGVKCTAIVFPVETPEIHGQRRYLKDDRGLDWNKWIEVAKSQFNDYFGATLDEGFVDIQRLSLSEVATTTHP